MFYFNWRRFLADSFHALFPAGNPHLRIDGHRARVLAMFFFCMAWMVGSARLGLLADHLLFPWFRKARVDKPLFIVGNFRSGSTMLHRLLAGTPGIAALKTWEIYFAPSISQRKFWRGFWIVDGWFGGHVRRAILKAQKQQLGAVTMHRIRLDEPEEDEGLFLYLWDSLFNWFFIPRDAHANPYWRYDERLPRWRRRRAMEFYREVLRRHMALQPTGAVYVSKSPAFTARLASLIETFPDARFIELVRHPFDCVVSTAGWCSFAWHFFASPRARFPFLDTILEMTRYWYLRPEDFERRLPREQYALIHYEDLVSRPTEVVPRALEQFGIPVSTELVEAARRLQDRPRTYRTHDHTLDELGIDEDEAEQFYRRVMERFGYRP
ncbi:MAG: sulfotransferase family protein [Spirochaetota bacterium]